MNWPWLLKHLTITPYRRLSVSSSPFKSFSSSQKIYITSEFSQYVQRLLRVGMVLITAGLLHNLYQKIEDSGKIW